MKRLLLLIFLAGPLLSPAQEPDNTPMRYDFHAASEYTQQSDSLLITTHQGRRLFFDTDGNSYIPRKAFIEKYGRENFRQLVDFENERIRAKRQEEERLELERTKKLAIRKIEKLDIYESLSEIRNEYYEILDALDGEVDGAIDYPKAAQFFRDHFAGIDANGNISTTTVIGCPNLSKNNIYIQAHSWFVNSFNSGKSVIQFDDKEAGTILAKGYLRDIALYAPFGKQYGISARVLFRIDIKEERARIIMTIQEYDIAVSNGRCSSLQGTAAASNRTYRPDLVYPFNDNPDLLPNEAGAKAYCASCLYLIAMKNRLDRAINAGIIGIDMNDNW